MKKLKAKLRGRSGETIGETLVALLISALAILMLAGAISSASNMIDRGKQTMTRYYAEENASSDFSGEGVQSIDLTMSDLSGTVTQTAVGKYNEIKTFADKRAISYDID